VHALVVNKHVEADAECASSLAFPTTHPNNLEASIGGTTPSFTLKAEVLALFFFGHELCRSFPAKRETTLFYGLSPRDPNRRERDAVGDRFADRCLRFVQ
jgi:hypothetical protein